MRSNISLLAISLFLSSMLTGHALAQKTTIEADVKGSDGKPAQSAEVRIERQDKKARPVITRTDGRGHVAAKNLDAGTYKLTVLTAGAPPQDQLVTTAPNKPVLIKIDMKGTAGGAAQASKKVYVWVDPPTGSHMGGHYEEAGSPRAAKAPGAQNVENTNAAAIQRAIVLPPPATGAR